MLLDFGCTQSQGYLHSRPLPATEFVALLRDGCGELTRPGETPSGR
jgi:EAL domain-containing protein (putative c-di-GMP-specific phosphodiesterase class I)